MHLSLFYFTAVLVATIVLIAGYKFWRRHRDDISDRLFAAHAKKRQKARAKFVAGFFLVIILVNDCIQIYNGRGASIGWVLSGEWSAELADDARYTLRTKCEYPLVTDARLSATRTLQTISPEKGNKVMACYIREYSENCITPYLFGVDSTSVMLNHTIFHHILDTPAEKCRFQAFVYRTIKLSLFYEAARSRVPTRAFVGPHEFIDNDAVCVFMFQQRWRRLHGKE